MVVIQASRCLIPLSGQFQASWYLVLLSGRSPGFTITCWGLSYFPVNFWASKLVFKTYHYLVDSRLCSILEISRYYSVESELHSLNLRYTTIWSLPGFVVFWRNQDIIRSNPSFIAWTRIEILVSIWLNQRILDRTWLYLSLKGKELVVCNVMMYEMY